MLTNNIPLNIFIAATLGYFLASVAKIIIMFFKGEKVRLLLAFSTGGMPSSHSATVTALATSIFMHEGFSTSFVIAFFFACVVIADAFGVRMETGKQAHVINQMMKKDRIKAHKFNELVGHTPKQVLVGAIFGICIAILFYFVRI